jgi:hypothetical protein
VCARRIASPSPRDPLWTISTRSPRRQPDPLGVPCVQQGVDLGELDEVISAAATRQW